MKKGATSWRTTGAIEMIKWWTNKKGRSVTVLGCWLMAITSRENQFFWPGRETVHISTPPPPHAAIQQDTKDLTEANNAQLWVWSLMNEWGLFCCLMLTDMIQIWSESISIYEGFYNFSFGCVLILIIHCSVQICAFVLSFSADGHQLTSSVPGQKIICTSSSYGILVFLVYIILFGVCVVILKSENACIRTQKLSITVCKVCHVLQCLQWSAPRLFAKCSSLQDRAVHNQNAHKNRNEWCAVWQWGTPFGWRIL